MKDFFFDRKVVHDAIGREKRKAISRSLAFVRTRARSLLRRRKKPSLPGKPPSIHSQQYGLKTILFAYDPRIQGGIVGPVKLNQVNMTWRGSQPVPSIMEMGGQVKIHETKSFSDGKWYRRDLRRRLRPNQKRRIRSANYAPRPFMTPALEIEAEKGNILSPWANVVGS